MNALRHIRTQELWLRDWKLGALSPSAVATCEQTNGSNASQRPMPAHIGRYDVEAETSHGALITVFRAFDRDIGRRVKLKLLTDVTNRSLVERFVREVVNAANLRHASISAIYELGDHAGLPFVAMEDAGDDDLRRAIETQRPLILLQKMLIMWKAAEGVRAAHRSGLSYVGLRPSGIALGSDGCVTIQDFGIVRATDGAQDENVSYSSPEELAADFLPDSLCDIFAFGVIYYELLTGRHPFLAGSSSDGKIDILNHEPPPLRDLAPDCPEALARIVHRALDKQRELRYQSLDDVQCDAEPILRELKRTRAATLLAHARRLMESQELDDAQSLVRAALDLNPENRKAYRLHMVVQGLLQRQRVQSRLVASLREADEEAAICCFSRAVEILESALRLDGANLSVRNRLEQMRSRVEQRQRSSQLVAEARRLWDQQCLTEADGKAAKAVESDPTSVEAIELLQSIGEAVERQAAEAKRQADLEEQLRQARSFLAQRRYAEALAKLETLNTELPEERQVSDLMVQARQELDRASDVAQAISLCEQFRREEQFDHALEVLDSALAAYPSEPDILTMRRDVQEQWQEFKTAAAARPVLDEAQWLVEQDHPDLAAEFLRQRSADFLDQPNYRSRIEAIEKMLPDWEKRRFLHDTLDRVAHLEHRQQWPVALTVLEEALESCPASPELLEASGRLGSLLRDQRQQKKLARRVEMIRRKIVAEAWSQALALIDSAETTFPDQPELQDLRKEVQNGLRCTECESIIAEVRQYLADGETEEAEEILRKGIASLGEEPALQALREELEADRKYKDEWRAAQFCFGRRQFQEAEQILVRLTEQNRPDVQALLETVREARAANEEHQLYKGGRQKALKLIQQHLFGQAADLLCNLLALFPGDPVLERDLRCAQGRREDPVLASEKLGEPEPPEPHAEFPCQEPPVQLEEAKSSRWARARIRGAVIAAAALFLLVAASAAVWKFSQNELPAPWQTPPTSDSGQQAPAPSSVPDAGKPRSGITPEAPRQAITVLTLSGPEAAPIQGSLILHAAGTEAVVSKWDASHSAADVLGAVDPTEPAGVPKNAGRAVITTIEPSRDGNFQALKFISGPSPVMPQSARELGARDVTLEATVDKRGRVTNVLVVSGDPLLVSAATNAILKWRFQPARLNGQPLEINAGIQLILGAGQR